MAEKRWDEMSSEEQEAVREQTAAQVEKFLEDRNAHAAHDQRAVGRQGFGALFPVHVAHLQRLLAREKQVIMPVIGIGGDRKSFPARGGHSNR